MQPFFITSSGTGIGKTLITTTLCWQLRQMGKKVVALKPVISGYDPQDKSSDTALILKSRGLEKSPADTISPWRFAAPLSPNMAAAQEGAVIILDELVDYCRRHATDDTDALLVEGAGGVMAPLNDRHTMLDWMAQLGWPVVMVAGSYLGSLSHTLTALEALRAKCLPIHALVVSESPQSEVPLDDTVRTLEKFVASDIPIVRIPRIRTKEDMWTAMPLISWICQ